MLKICDDADKVLQQLNVTIASYDSLMKQLEVDISMVESEKKNVTELLQDYIQNIHKNLARIGSNSTIKIREKSLKMLKITLPVWEDNEKLYNLRLSDFVDEITEEGIHLFENNENAQESEEKLQAKTYMILWWELEMFRFSFIKLKNRENDR